MLIWFESVEVEVKIYIVYCMVIDEWKFNLFHGS